jgi:hypothetical protein
MDGIAVLYGLVLVVLVGMAGFLLMASWIGAVKSGLRQGIARFAKTLTSCKNPYFLGPIFSWKSIFGLLLGLFSGYASFWATFHCRFFGW